MRTLNECVAATVAVFVDEFGAAVVPGWDWIDEAFDTDGLPEERRDEYRAAVVDGVRARASLIRVGDWVVAGTVADNVDAGRIASIDGDRATVAWEWAGEGQSSLVDLTTADVAVYSTRMSAFAEAKLRCKERDE